MTLSFEFPNSLLPIDSSFWAYRQIRVSKQPSINRLNGTLEILSGCSVGISVFANCYSITGFVIPETITSIPSSLFSNCYGLKGESKLHDKIISIGSNAFEYCYGFTGQLELPDSIEKLKNLCLTDVKDSHDF